MNPTPEPSPESETPTVAERDLAKALLYGHCTVEEFAAIIHASEKAPALERRALAAEARVKALEEQLENARLESLAEQSLNDQ